MKFGGNRNKKCYCFYEIIKFLNNVYELKNYPQHILFTEYFINCVQKKIKQFTFEIKNSDDISSNIRNNIYIEFKRFHTNFINCKK